MKKTFSIILIAFATSLVTFAVAKNFIYSDQVFSMSQHSSTNPDAHFANYAEPSADGSGGYVNLEDAADRASKAVVHIKTEKKMASLQNRNPFGDDLFEQFFGQRGGGQFFQPQPQQGSGSGVIISEDGYIVTNNHVVDGADEVTVVMNDKKTLTAKVIGKDAATDLALLKVEEDKLPYLSFGNSDDVRLGQWVLAVGYPLSLETTVTAGIVSAKYRNIGINQTKIGNGSAAVESFIQTDAAVNPGNSGGALVNARGEVIGINSAIASPTGSYAGYSFAIPSNIVHKVTNDMMKYGNVQRAFLGVSFIDSKTADPKELSKLGLDKYDGVSIKEVNKESAAEDAGLKEGDIITKIGNKDIKSGPQLSEQVAQYRPGDKTTVTFIRNGIINTGNITFKNRIGNTDIVKNDANGQLGASLKELSKAECRALRVNGGVQISGIKPNGALAKQTRIKNSFIITQINDDPVESIDDLNKILASGENDFQLGGVYPNIQGVYYYIIRLN
jgi:S1-C subfamily serine protease